MCTSDLRNTKSDVRYDVIKVQGAVSPYQETALLAESECNGLSAFLSHAAVYLLSHGLPKQLQLSACLYKLLYLACVVCAKCIMASIGLLGHFRNYSADLAQ